MAGTKMPLPPKSFVQSRRKMDVNKKIILIFIISTWISFYSWGQELPISMKRFHFSGDGNLSMLSERTNLAFEGQYRIGSDTYDKNAIEKICQVFGAPSPDLPMGLSLRLVEFLDFLQDHFNPEANITITSGYRKPEYNTMLRKKGNLAAKASLHQYGMAADLKIEGVNAKTLWNYVKSLKFGGAGYYNGSVVHVDVGPARFWDQNTSGVGTGISDDNKLICLVTDFDRYHPGDDMCLRFIRMTAFPIQIQPEFTLIPLKGQGPAMAERSFKPVFQVSNNDNCPEFHNIEQMDRIIWQLPSDIAPGAYTIKARCCGNRWKEMPSEIQSHEIQIYKYKDETQ